MSLPLPSNEPLQWRFMKRERREKNQCLKLLSDLDSLVQDWSSLAEVRASTECHSTFLKKAFKLHDNIDMLSSRSSSLYRDFNRPFDSIVWSLTSWLVSLLAWFKHRSSFFTVSNCNCIFFYSQWRPLFFVTADLHSYDHYLIGKVPTATLFGSTENVTAY